MRAEKPVAVTGVNMMHLKGLQLSHAVFLESLWTILSPLPLLCPFGKEVQIRVQVRCRHWPDTDLGSCWCSVESLWKVGNQRRIEIVCVSSPCQGCAGSWGGGERRCDRAQQGVCARCCYSCCSQFHGFLWVFPHWSHSGPNHSLQHVCLLPAHLFPPHLLRGFNYFGERRNLDQYLVF